MGIYFVFDKTEGKEFLAPDESWRSPMVPWPKWAEKQIEDELRDFLIPKIPPADVILAAHTRKRQLYLERVERRKQRRLRQRQKQASRHRQQEKYNEHTVGAFHLQQRQQLLHRPHLEQQQAVVGHKPQQQQPLQTNVHSWTSKRDSIRSDLFSTLTASLNHSTTGNATPLRVQYGPHPSPTTPPKHEHPSMNGSSSVEIHVYASPADNSNSQIVNTNTVPQTDVVKKREDSPEFHTPPQTKKRNTRTRIHFKYTQRSEDHDQVTHVVPPNSVNRHSSQKSLDFSMGSPSLDRVVGSLPPSPRQSQSKYSRSSSSNWEALPKMLSPYGLIDTQSCERGSTSSSTTVEMLDAITASASNTGRQLAILHNADQRVESSTTTTGKRDSRAANGHLPHAVVPALQLSISGDMCCHVEHLELDLPSARTVVRGLDDDEEDQEDQEASNEKQGLAGSTEEDLLNSNTRSRAQSPAPEPIPNPPCLTNAPSGFIDENVNIMSTINIHGDMNMNEHDYKEDFETADEKEEDHDDVYIPNYVEPKSAPLHSNSKEVNKNKSVSSDRYTHTYSHHHSHNYIHSNSNVRRGKSRKSLSSMRKAIIRKLVPKKGSNVMKRVLQRASKVNVISRTKSKSRTQSRSQRGGSTFTALTKHQASSSDLESDAPVMEVNPSHPDLHTYGLGVVLNEYAAGISLPLAPHQNQAESSGTGSNGTINIDARISELEGVVERLEHLVSDMSVSDKSVKRASASVTMHAKSLRESASSQNTTTGSAERGGSGSSRMIIMDAEDNLIQLQRSSSTMTMEDFDWSADMLQA